jgi:WXG100 family type VII secretion target
MSMYVADLEQLTALAATFDRQSQAVAEVTAVVRSDVLGANWQSPAATRFREAWTGEFEPALRRLQAAMQEAATEVNRRREAIQAAGA